jgi:putative nucleotidyltransferase-like protein
VSGEHPPNRAGSLNAEWATLLECASPHPNISCLNELVRRPIDWSSLQSLADEHGVLPLLAIRLRDLDESLVLAETRQKLREWQRSQVVFSLSLTAELFRLLDRFTASGLEVLLTKGPVLAARCYGDPGSRQYTDLDLIVRGKDIQRATEMMIALGYEPKVPLKAIEAKKLPGEYVFTQRDTGLLVEFHTEHTFRYHPRPLPVEKLFERRACVRFDGHDVPALSVEDELILICIHGAKHFWTRLMWIADVAALVSRQDVDWDRAMAAAGEVGAERMLRVGLRLAVELLGVPFPDRVARDVQADHGAERVAAQIALRLPLGDAATFGIFRRAAFRMKMRGGYLQGAAYLLRLSLSPTEEDWVSGSEEKRSWLLDSMGRPFRLARKYGRDGRAGPMDR